MDAVGEGEVISVSSGSLSVSEGEADPLGDDVLVEPDVLVDVGLDVALPPSAFSST